ncbi:retrovirus-related pol polyprotein from transposon TNT 1-94 [Tanacetum coccineum]
MLAPKGSTFNGRLTFSNPMYLKKTQYEKPCLYEIPYDTSDLPNVFSPDREETLTLEKGSRSKLNKDKVQSYDYTKQNSLYENFKPASQEYHDQLAHENEVRNKIELVDQAWEKHTHDRFRAPTALDMEGNDLLIGNRESDIYTISLQETTSSTPICFIAKASPTQAWLWHRRLSHLNFDYINLLSKKDIVIGLPKGTKFLNKTLHAYFKEEGIEHQTSTPRTPEQNGVVERRNRTLVEAARTMLSASKLPLFFWAEAIATACYTQNRSIIIPTHEKTAYHIINDRKPSIRHLHIFGCTCYLTRDGENLDKMKEKGDPCILVGYSTQSKGYRVYNKRTRLIVESIHIKFDEIKEMTETSVDNNTSGLVLQRQKASDYDNSGPAPQLQNVSPSADTTAPSQQELDLLFGPLYDEFFTAGTSSVNKSSSPIDNSTKQDTQPTMNIHPSTKPITPTTTVHVKENNDNQSEIQVDNAHVDDDEFYNVFSIPVHEEAESSSRYVDPSNMHTFYQPRQSEH